MVHPVERLLGRTMLVVVGPATNDRVQQTNQHGLADRLVRIHDSTDFLQERVRVLLRRLHQWFAIVLFLRCFPDGFGYVRNVRETRICPFAFTPLTLTGFQICATFVVG